MKKTGRLAVVAIFAVSGALALIAVLYWKDPENRTRWSFTRFHSLLLRNHPEQAATFVARQVVFDGRTLSRGEFMAAYVLPERASEVQTEPCPSDGGHWTVRMKDRVYCFRLEENLWKLDRLGGAPCDCGS